MFGTPSNELKELLQFHLTDKKLKKLGSSIETSYTNIQKLLLRNLQSVGQALLYHLTDVHALADVTAGQSPSIGLEVSLASAAVSIAGSFMLKTVELQQACGIHLVRFFFGNFGIISIL